MTFLQKRTSIGVVGLSLSVWVMVILMSQGCTISELVIYKTSNYPAVQITPSAKIGPS